MQEIKGKVTFNYRNQRNETLSVGRKSAIKKAWAALQEVKSTEIVKVPKKKGEKLSTYHRRVTRLKKKYGVGGNAINGIPVSVPPGGKARINKKGELTITGKRSDGEKIRERLVPLTDRERLVTDTRDYVREVLLDHKPDVAWPFYEHWRGNRGRRFVYDDGLEEDIDSITDEIEDTLNWYHGAPVFLTGILMQWIG